MLWLFDECFPWNKSLQNFNSQYAISWGCTDLRGMQIKTACLRWIHSSSTVLEVVEVLIGIQTKIMFQDVHMNYIHLDVLCTCNRGCQGPKLVVLSHVVVHVVCKWIHYQWPGWIIHLSHVNDYDTSKETLCVEHTSRLVSELGFQKHRCTSSTYHCLRCIRLMPERFLQMILPASYRSMCCSTNWMNPTQK